MEALTFAQVVGGGAALALLVIWVWRSSLRPSIIERLERSMVSNQNRLDTQEGEIDELRRQIHELREGRIADHALLQEWIGYARRLATMFREATGKEPPHEPAAHMATTLRPARDRAHLARQIAERFAPGEIHDLAFTLGLAEDVSGETAKERALSLVGAATRRDFLEQLRELCRHERPNVEW